MILWILCTARKLLSLSEMVLSPKESGKVISKLSKNVVILSEGVSKLSEKIMDGVISGTVKNAGFCNVECHPKPSKDAIDWVFVVDTLNFCFWSETEKSWEVKWHGKTYTGYFALCAALNKAAEEGIDITNPQVYSQLTATQLQHILHGDNGVTPTLIKERLDSLHQVGVVLLEKYGGSFVNCVTASNKSAQNLLKLIVTEFPCFRDEADYHGMKLSFYKRAQILIADMWSMFEGKSFGEFYDINTLTMFADYRVPQVLVHFEVLKYSDELYKTLESKKVLKNGSEEEIEIRGCSIEAVEQVKEKIEQTMKDRNLSLECNSILIDYFLWTYRRDHREELEKIPFHRVVSIYY